ncbi:phosphoglycerate dehydrogenase [Nitrosomonas sp. PY1]|uniref:phosphoglycerate dehydrogenase n=1 Tax=Nitrosomonas sp. PY1 TaxID=1803906 RepID=UPI00283A9CDA|nr:phosphoglycerate dehydrogenase [Nitrosomonas sp. PY1]
MMKTLVISTSSFDIDHNLPLQQLIQKGFRIVTNPHRRKLSEDEIIELLHGEAIGLIAGIEPLTERVFQATPTLKVVSRCGAGLDSVDLNAAQKHGIAVLNTPEAPAQAVAELTMGLMLSLLRQINSIDQVVRKGEWPRLQGRLLAAQTVGIVGIGHIGRRVAKLCQAFEAKVIAHDSFVTQVPQGIALVSLEELLSSADIITLHLPYTPQTHHLLDKKAFASLKPEAMIINAARGGLIDECALAEALNSGRVSAAALDTFEQEPYTGELNNCNNIILTSHVGSLARESRQRMEIEAAENLFQELIKMSAIQ